MAQFVFGYGSLAVGGRPFVLEGYRRRWGVAMDNSVDLPDYKYFVHPATGERPRVMVAFLDLVEEPDAAVEGALLEVADFAELDERERNYERREIEPGVYAYFGRGDARERFERGPTVIASSYYDLVKHLDVPTDLPVEELIRVDLP